MKAYQILPTPPEPCQANLYGHSWLTLNHTEQNVSQRCRFCRQTRTLPTYTAKQPRQKAQKGA